MRTTSFKSRAFALVSTAALLATLVVASPANAAATGPTCDGATPVQTCTGTTSDGALYKMVVPADFNGVCAPVLLRHADRYRSQAAGRRLEKKLRQ